MVRAGLALRDDYLADNVLRLGSRGRAAHCANWPAPHCHRGTGRLAQTGQRSERIPAEDNVNSEFARSGPDARVHAATSVRPPGSMLESALRYAAAVCWLISLREPTKRPATAHCSHDASTDPEQLRA